MIDGKSSSFEVAKDRRSGFRSSMYNSLRTNLPREVMSYTSLPFLPDYMGGRSVDPRRFPCHEEVNKCLGSSLYYLSWFSAFWCMFSVGDVK